MRVLSISPAWHALGLFESRALTLIGALPVMPWGTLTSRFAADILSAVTQLSPEHLLVTARALRLLLAECDRLGLDSRSVFRSVRYVGCAGESLSSTFRQHVRRRLELEDIFERGGSSDGMFGGGECVAKRGHHVSADVHYVEIVDPRSGEAIEEGQRGTAVVTNLTLGKSLYVRFDTEDVAEIVPGDCPCGRTHPVVEFYSRLADSVVLDDRIVTPADAREILDEFEVTRFRSVSIGSRGADDLVVGVGGEPDGWVRHSSDLTTALSERLGVTATVQSGESVGTGWKEERIAGRDAAG
jgi:phenylacetate-coenzyme A ligase PaaK-like adenylate-forming protein